MDDATLHDLLRAVRIQVRDFTSSVGLPELLGPIDKYGSYVFEMGGDVDGLNRYITFSLTPDDKDDQRLIVSYQIGADDGERYAGRAIESMPAFSNDIRKRLKEQLTSVWFADVLPLTAADLNQTYVIPRPGPRSAAAPASVRQA